MGGNRGKIVWVLTSHVTLWWIELVSSTVNKIITSHTATPKDLRTRFSMVFCGFLWISSFLVSAACWSCANIGSVGSKGWSAAGHVPHLESYSQACRFKHQKTPRGWHHMQRPAAELPRGPFQLSCWSFQSCWHTPPVSFTPQPGPTTVAPTSIDGAS